jgi:hypothetical protein
MGNGTIPVPASTLAAPQVDVAPGAPVPQRFPEAGGTATLVIQHGRDLREGTSIVVPLKIRVISPLGVLGPDGEVQSAEAVVTALLGGYSQELLDAAMKIHAEILRSAGGTKKT